jgi:hypothetical protein
MPTLMDPFSPLPEKVLFNNLGNMEKYFEKLFEKINSYINIIAEGNKNKQSNSSAITAAILAGYDSLSSLDSRSSSNLIIFNSNKIAPAKLSHDDVDYNKLYCSENEIKAFLPQVNIQLIFSIILYQILPINLLKKE